MRTSNASSPAEASRVGGALGDPEDAVDGRVLEVLSPTLLGLVVNAVSLIPAYRVQARSNQLRLAPIVIGQTLCHDGLLRELGRDDMGVVSEAEDMRPGREVALELLPEDLAHGIGRVLPMLEAHQASAE